jgi:predicted flap endonuclease-1-like 5' DNA nuclease
LEWRNRYLESRVRSLETQAHELSNAAVVVEIETESETEDEAPAEPTGQPPVVVEGEETPQQELARLRWRNRYLEGRVAYYEGGEGEVEAEAGSNGHGGLAAAAGAAVAAAAATALVSDDDDNEASESDDDETAADAVLHALENEEAVTEPAPDPVDPEKPDTLDKPRGKSGDDLTEISGVGPKIQDVLHEMGVYHFDQVADWSAENVAWVDEQLSFSGRIDREEWVSQAKALTEAVAEDA